MKKAAVRASTTNAAVAHGVELAGQLGATAVEMRRVRRDPAMQARKKRRAAKRRLVAWSAGAILIGGGTASGLTAVVQGDHSSGAIGGMVVLVAVLIWCIVGIVRAARDLRTRSRVVAQLPDIAPARPVVASEIRPEMARLDGYSDGLRQLIGMIGIVQNDPGVRQMRDEILVAADRSEARLRQQAVDLSGLIRARRTAPADGAARLTGTVDVLQQQIRAGVVAYGELVSAASEAVAASRSLRDGALGAGPAVASDRSTPVDGTLQPGLTQSIDQLRALAAGMRELTEG
jgi:hypothetical protein